MFIYFQEAFSDFAMFFYDPCGGKYITVIWKPDLFESKDFQVGSVSLTSVVKGNKLKVKKETVLEDLKIILSGICTTIEEL